MTLEDLVRLGEEQARRVLIGTKEELVPSWLLLDENGPTILATPWADNREKQLVTHAMRKTMRERQVIAYSLLVEAWFVVVPEEQYEGPPPSERDDRKEAVVVMAANRDGQHLYRQLAIVRDKEGACVELRRLDGPEDRVNSLLFDNLLDQRKPS